MPDQHSAEEKPCLPPEIELELKQLRELNAIMIEDFKKLDQLARNGFLNVQAGERWIDGMIREITSLRAERIPPVMNVEISEAVKNGFAVMQSQIRETMHKTEITIHELRFQAFLAGVCSFIPLIVSKGRLEVYNLFSGILSADIQNARRIIDSIESNGQAATAYTSERIKQLETEVSCKTNILQIIHSLTAGGLTAEQLLAQAELNRVRASEEAGIRTGVSVN